MNALTEYFAIMAVLLAVYFAMRWIVAAYIEGSGHTMRDYLAGFRNCRNRPLFSDGKGIETAPIVDRIQQVRDELTQAKVPVQARRFKRALAVENKRAQIAALSFFQTPRPPEVERHDQEHGFYFILA